MAYRVSAFNNKGGSTKTTTTIQLAHRAVDNGMRVLVVDCDLQGNASSYLTGQQYPDSWFDLSIADVLTPGDDDHPALHPRGAIVPTQRPGLDLLPAGDLTAMEKMEQALVKAPEGREFTLDDALVKIDDDYDLILIDSPPSVNVVTANVHIAARTGIIIVATPSHGDVQGVVKTYATINSYDAFDGILESPVRTIGMVISRMDTRTKAKAAAREQLEMLADEMGIPQLCIPIPEWSFIAEATVVGHSVAASGDSRAPFIQSQYQAILDAITKETR